MTAPSSIDPARFLHEQLAQASPDLLRQMLTTFINTLMSAEADAVCGAEYGVRSAERTNTRNGYRHRDFDTRAGTLDVAIPKLRSGSYFPDWLLERRRRAERALTTVVATCYLLEVSTRRMEKLVESLGITRLSKSPVSEMAKELDGQVVDFRHRPLNVGPYTFIAADTLVLKAREGGRVVNVRALVAARSRRSSADSSLVTPERAPASTSARRTYLRTVAVEPMPSLIATERIASPQADDGRVAASGRSAGRRGCGGHGGGRGPHVRDGGGVGGTAEGLQAVHLLDGAQHAVVVNALVAHAGADHRTGEDGRDPVRVRAAVLVKGDDQQAV